MIKFAFLLLLLSYMAQLHVPPWTSWHNEILAYAAGLLLAVSTLRVKNGPSVKVPQIAAVFMVFLGVALSQLAAGIISFRGNIIVVFFCVALCLLCLSIGFSSRSSVDVVSGRSNNDEKILPCLAWTLVTAAVASIFIAFCQVLDVWQVGPPLDGLRRPGANLAQPNHLASLIVMAGASVVFLRGLYRWSTLPILLLFLCLAMGLAITESRTGLLSFLALTIWWYWKYPKSEPSASKRLVFAITLMTLTLFAIWPAMLTAFLRMEDSSLAVRGDVFGDSRLNVWPQFIQAAWQKPWLGWGINQAAKAHNAVAHLYPPSAPFTYSHNLLLDLAVWVGLPLALLASVAMAVWMWRRVVATNGTDSWYGLAVALPVAVHSMFEYPFAYAYFLVPAMLGIGAAESALGMRAWILIPRRVALAIVLATTALMAWSAWEYIEAEEDYRVARFQLLNVGEMPANYKRPNFLLLNQLGALTDSMRVPVKKNMPERDVALLRAVAMEYPFASVEYRYALALVLNGKQEEAERQFAVMRAQHSARTYLHFCKQLAETLVRAGSNQIEICKNSQTRENQKIGSKSN